MFIHRKATKIKENKSGNNDKENIVITQTFDDVLT